MGKNKIKITGAKEHNLKSVNLEIPKDKLIVITGPSGSGKSSLALDTLYAEGKRRYVESLSSYARQFLGISKRPNVEKIEGLCPAIAIDQKTVGYNPRSTVGTITEIYDYLRVLYARIGTPHCPECGEKINAKSPEQISKMLQQEFSKQSNSTKSGQSIIIAAPIAIAKKGEFKHQLKRLFEQGYNRFLIDGIKHRFQTENQIDKLKIEKTYKHNISVLLDKIELISHKSTLQSTVNPEPIKELPTKQEDTSEVDLQRLQEAIEKAFKITNGLCQVIDQKNKSKLYSSHRICIKCVRSFPELEPRSFSFNSPIGACEQCHGLGFIQTWHDSMQFYQSKIVEKSFTTNGWQNIKEKTCSYCKGKRLKDEPLAVTINDKNIFDVTTMSLKNAYQFFSSLKLDREQQEIARPLLKEIVGRLKFLNNVGLYYLTLGRMARTLSGGEGQRIRLATQIGSGLSGVLYILDEPSIGLHQRDNDKLIKSLKKLRDQGNTVIVVEHDMDTIKQADFLIDVGPAAGTLGGKISATGTPKQVAQNKDSLTGQYLSGKRKIEIPKQRRKPVSFLTLKGASANNLQNIDVQIPLGVFVAVSGVSGSGKSSLIMQTLAPGLKIRFGKGWDIIPQAKGLQGAESLKNCVLVNQSPIGRTPRSNPATYLGIFDHIRSLYASLPESNLRGYKPGQFSFNVKAGRCFECNGDGYKKISMHFLEDVIVQCKSCKGLRYSEQTLQIKYRGKNIAEVLDLTALEAMQFFKNFPPIEKRLKLMCDVGLDYLKLGQSSKTLSGGEAQRIKLVNELAKRGQETMYILDEPTTGLHSCDVEKLLHVLNRLVDRGNTVLVIEHNLDILKSADYIIDIGLQGGDQGGNLVAFGTPEQVAKVTKSYTGKYLKNILKKNNTN